MSAENISKRQIFKKIAKNMFREAIKQKLFFHSFPCLDKIYLLPFLVQIFNSSKVQLIKLKRVKTVKSKTDRIFYIYVLGFELA